MVYNKLDELELVALALTQIESYDKRFSVNFPSLVELQTVAVEYMLS